MKIISLILVLSVFFLPFNLYACSCPQKSLEEKYKEASMVFIGHVYMAKEVTNDSRAIDYPSKGYVEVTYRVVETFKGRPHDGGSVLDGVYSVGSCSVGMLPGVEYIFFLDSVNAVSACNGTQFYTSGGDDKIVKKLRIIRKLK